MKKILLLAILALAFSACAGESSDDWTVVPPLTVILPPNITLQLENAEQVAEPMAVIHSLALEESGLKEVLNNTISEIENIGAEINTNEHSDCWSMAVVEYTTVDDIVVILLMFGSEDNDGSVSYLATIQALEYIEADQNASRNLNSLRTGYMNDLHNSCPTE